MALGPHKIEYEVIEGWERMPEGWSFVEVAGVACDSKDRVYVFNRGEHPVIVFDKEGKFQNAWGEGMFVGPHGIFIDRADNLWLADDKNHVVHKCTADGKILQGSGRLHQQRLRCRSTVPSHERPGRILGELPQLPIESGSCRVGGARPSEPGSRPQPLAADRFGKRAEHALDQTAGGLGGAGLVRGYPRPVKQRR